MHSSLYIANKFLEKSKHNDSNDLTTMKILKLVYIAHGWMLGIHSLPLIEEDIEAWRYGPVIPELYYSVKKYKGAPITELISIEVHGDELSDKEENIISQVYDVYNPRSAMNLSSLTHMQGTPWYMVYNHGEGQGGIIPIDLIDDYYKGLISKNSK